MPIILTSCSNEQRPKALFVSLAIAVSKNSITFAVQTKVRDVAQSG